MTNVARLIPFLSLFFAICFCINDTYSTTIFKDQLTTLATTSNSIDLDMFAQNNILFYDNSCETSSSGSSDEFSNASGYDRLREAVQKYGEAAMDLQRKYGTPWTMIFAQMMQESGVGTAGVAVNGADNNWLGITGTGDTGEQSGRFAIFSSVEASMEAWAGSKVLRSGYYDSCFSNLNPSSYNYDGFIECVIPIYAPASDGNSPSSYIAAVKSLIAVVNDEAKNQGWSTAPELAKTENIPQWGYCGESMSTCDNPSSSSGSTATTINITWEDGWITDGMDGYVKEPAVGSGYTLPEEASSIQGGHTQSYTTGSANKILLHTTEGGAGDGSSGLALYGPITKGGETGITPAHFTINLKDRKVFQHFSINNPSDAIIEDLDGGIQIEIIGYMDNLDFTDDDWDYLATLLIGINQETGIPLTSSVDWSSVNRMGTDEFRDYSGVLGHMHAPSDQNHNDPGNIWQYIEEAIKRVQNAMADVCESTSPSGDLENYVLAYAWPDYHAPNYYDMMPDYEAAVEKRQSEGKYVGGGSHPGIDCGGFVTTLMQESGFDSNYNEGGGATSTQQSYTAANWQYLGNNIDTSTLQQGDVAFSASGGHTWVYVGKDISGFGEGDDAFTGVASASYSTSGSSWRTPMAGHESLGNGAKWYRKE